ncbi:MAG: FHA domain-containing protein [Azoarcus sp.]|jgi:hypothetical protein|nr:FHA domain-containing protein [Azoarcus sp.]
MSNFQNLCVLAAEIVGGDRLAERLGEAETARAVERCLNRVDLAIGGSGGEIIVRDAATVIATFGQCDDGVMAICEAIDRVRKLPPVSGAQMEIRAGIHYGAVKNDWGEGVEDARRILQVCAAGYALASSAVVAELSASVRNFASAESFHDSIHALPWPVFRVGSQNGISVPPQAHVQPASPPAVSSLPDSRPAHPEISPKTSLQAPPGPCLRLLHQQKTIFVGENRPVVLIGRELGNDIVIDDPRASRQHARIERRRTGFVLIDQSTNGCFVTLDGQEERCIKGNEYSISAAGRIGCGFSSQEFEDDLVFFEIAQENAH